MTVDTPNLDLDGQHANSMSNYQTMQDVCEYSTSTMMLKGAANTAMLKMAQTHPTACFRLEPLKTKMVIIKVKPIPPKSEMSIKAKVEICNPSKNIYCHVSLILTHALGKNKLVKA